jgi:hypothetical protein
MKAFLAIAALLAAAPLAAQEQVDNTIYLTPIGEVNTAVALFFKALRNDDKTALAEHMDARAMITIHNRMDPKAPKIVFIPVAQHLENWLKSPTGIDERMFNQAVDLDGDMAHVWGPYRFTVDGKTSHCGINSLSLVRADGKWKVANTSFTMELPERCAALGAPEAPAS